MVDVRPYPSVEPYEKIVLSCLAWRSHLFDEFPNITESHFYTPAHQLVFRTIKYCRKGADFVDLTNAVIYANEQGWLENAGGPATFADCFNACHGDQWKQFPAMVESLNRYYARRLAIIAAQELVEAAFDTSEESEFIAKASEPITAIHDAFQGQSKEVGKTEFLNKFAKAYEDRITGRNNGRGYQTSLDAINDTIGGIYTKQVMIIAGKPTSGKSILAGQLLWDLAKEGIPVSFLSLELPGEKVMERLAIYVAGKPAIAISKPIEFANANQKQAVTKMEMIHVANVIRRIEESPFQVDDSCGQYIGQIVAKIRRHHRRYGTKVFAVDYVQIIRSSRGKNASKEEETADISHTFQALAKELDVAILLLSQLNQQNQTKYASAIFEDADTMLTIIMDEGTNYHRAIGIKKDRHNGKTGEVLPIVMDKTMLRFIPKPFGWDEAAPETAEEPKKKWER
jgi:replicative DNA helicase